MSSQRHGPTSSICLPINFMFASAIVVHSVPNDDVISTSERCISRQDFPYRRCYIDIRCDITAPRYGCHTFCPARVTSEYSACRGSTSLDFSYGPTAKSCIIKALRAALTENYIKEKTAEMCYPEGSFVARRDFLEREVFSKCSHHESIELARENYARACAG